MWAVYYKQIRKSEQRPPLHLRTSSETSSHSLERSGRPDFFSEKKKTERNEDEAPSEAPEFLAVKGNSCESSVISESSACEACEGSAEDWGDAVVEERTIGERRHGVQV